MLKSFFAVALLSTISTAFLPGSVDAANIEFSSCKDLNQAIALPKSVDTKLDTTLIARTRRRLKVVDYYSDRSFINHVGTGTFRCDGRSTLTGRSTQFSKVILNEPCCGNFVC